MAKAFRRLANMGKYTLGVYMLQTIFVEMFLEFITASKIEPSFLFVFFFTPKMSAIAIWAFKAITKFVVERYHFIAICLFGETQKNTAIELKVS